MNLSLNKEQDVPYPEQQSSGNVQKWDLHLDATALFFQFLKPPN